MFDGPEMGSPLLGVANAAPHSAFDRSLQPPLTLMHVGLLRSAAARPHMLERLWPLLVASLTAVVLFTCQHLYFELQSAHEDAADDAASILALVHHVGEGHWPGATVVDVLREASAGLDRVMSATYCHRAHCLSESRGSAPDCKSGRDWLSVCVTAADDASSASLTVRYSLVEVYLEALRAIAFFVLVLLIAAATQATASRRLRARLSSAETDLRRAATLDALTHLLNRSAFEMAVCAVNDRASADARSWTLMYLDLDGFKDINDHHGHTVGDAVLKEVADRLRSAVPDSALLGRFGGDKFALALCASSDRPAIERQAQRLMEIVSRPIDLETGSVSMGLSIGVAESITAEQPFGEALRRADLALYEAKHAGRGRLRYFDQAMSRHASDRYELLDALKAAIERKQFFLEYQPQVDVDGQLRGVEALARWRHPTRGMIRPDLFIAAAEQSGWMGPLGLLLLELACTDLQACRGGGTCIPYVSVNISPKQLADPSFVSVLCNVVERHGLTSRDVELEVTEGSLMDAATSEDAVRQLAALGFRIAIDDFGTGYSSLSRLHRLPVHKLKIDRAFIGQLEGDRIGTSIVESILALANRLGLKTVAEGVETREQSLWLKEAGCTLIQGYYYARPMARERLIDWIQDRRFARGDDAPAPVWSETLPGDAVKR